MSSVVVPFWSLRCGEGLQWAHVKHSTSTRSSSTRVLDWPPIRVWPFRGVSCCYADFPAPVRPYSPASPGPGEPNTVSYAPFRSGSRGVRETSAKESSSDVSALRVNLSFISERIAFVIRSCDATSRSKRAFSWM